jgi:outer membrane lipoprotein carrier protein
MHSLFNLGPLLNPGGKDINFVKKMCHDHPAMTIRMQKVAPVFLLLLLVFFTPRAVMAGPPPLAELVGRIQEVYDATMDMKASFRQELTVKSLRKTEREEGTFSFRKPYLMRWDYTTPKSKRLTVNEKEIWLYVPEDSAAYVQNTKQALKSRVIIKFLAGMGKITDDFQIRYSRPRATSVSGDYLLTLVPKVKDWGIDGLFVTVDSSSAYIKELRFTDALGNTTRVTFTNIIINSGLPTQLFSFAPPAGTEIVRMPN